MELPVLNFSNVPQTNLVILGAGPSINTSLDRIRRFQKQYNSIIVAASRHMPLDADYTLFVDDIRYAVAIDQIQSPKIIVGSWFNISNKELKKRKYMLLPAPQYPVVYNTNTIQMNSNNRFEHGLGNSGMACILVSPYFRPDKILIAGFDGPSDDLTHQIKFDGSRGKYSKNKQKRLKDMKIPFMKSDKIWKYLSSYNIEVFSIKEDRLWGLDKDKNNVKTYS
jgi:hypothetical protein